MLENSSHIGPSPSSLTDGGRDEIFASVASKRHTVSYGRVWSPERDGQLLALKAAPERWSEKQIGNAMRLSVGQLRSRLAVLRVAGVAVVRAPLLNAPRSYTPRESSCGGEAWPTRDLDQLSRLWDEGLTASQIGLRMGRSKNSIVGKAHRLDLPSRPSPIQRDGEAPVRSHVARVRPAACTLPPLQSAAEAPPESDSPIDIVAPIRVRPVTPVRVAAPLPKPPPAPRPLVPRSYGRIVECCWPIGDPGTREFRFCSDPSDPGRPYCEPHSRTAFARPPRAKPKDDGYARAEA